MREIKFRCWDTKTKKMLGAVNPFTDVTTTGGCSEGCCSETPAWITDKGNIERPFDDDQYIWEQFTGLKDKNGKDIYEGDILDTSKIGLRPLVVFWEKLAGGGWYPFSHNHVNPADCIVIGSINENPELASSDQVYWR